MERLTEWTGERWIATAKRVNGKLVGDKDIYALCAAYEDTGLTPEEITAVCRCRECVKFNTEDCPIVMYEFIGPYDAEATLFTANYSDGFCNFGVRREGEENVL